MVGLNPSAERRERSGVSVISDRARDEGCERCIVVGSFLAALSASALGVALHLLGMTDYGWSGLALSCSATAMVGIFTLFYLRAEGRRSGKNRSSTEGAGSLQDWQDQRWQ